MQTNIEAQENNVEMVTALLPMKGNSERVPNKNIKPFCGKPLCLWVLETLLASKFIKEILVDTDSSTIAEIVKERERVRVIPRPTEVCGDFVSMNLVLGHDLTFCETTHILQTHSTNPLLSVKTLDAAIVQYFSMSPEYDSLFSVNIWQNRFYWKDGLPVNHDPDVLLRTQDLPPLYEENSCLYLFSKQSFSQAGGRRVGKTPFLFPMPNRKEGMDIDNLDDFLMAEALAIAEIKEKNEDGKRKVT